MRSWLFAVFGVLSAAMRAADGQGTQPNLTQTAVQASRAAAAAGLDSLRQLARTHFQMLGFTEAGQAAGAALGDPIVEFYVRLDSLKAFTRSTNALTMLSGGDKVTYPVVSGGATRSSIQVERTRDVWRPVAYGGSTWIVAVADRRAQLAASERRPPADYFLVRIPALGIQFIGSTTSGALTLTAILDDARGRWRAGASLSAVDVFGQLVADARASKGLPI